MAHDEIAVEFCQVNYEIEGKSIVSDLNLAVRRGEVLVLLGRSGSGKTTALKLVNRLLSPTSGEVRVEGCTTAEWDAIRLRRRIGYIIQEVGLFPHFTVEQNVGVVPNLEGWQPKRTRSRVFELLHRVGLDPQQFANRYPHQLSGGQRQRVGVARALAADPPILLADEPFGALDPITRLDLQQEFRRLHAQLLKTAIFVTHDIHEALFLATRIGLMYCGQLVLLETPTAFLSSSHPEAQAFIRCLRSLPEIE